MEDVLLKILLAVGLCCVIAGVFLLLPSKDSEQYRYGQYLNASLFWNITSNLQVGAEYLRGWRTDFNGSTRHANRLNLAAKYHF